MRLYGRDALLHGQLPRLIGMEAADGLRLVRQEYREGLPVVLLTGRHGAGKTALLDAVQEAYDGGVPLSRVDLAELPSQAQRQEGPADTYALRSGPLAHAYGVVDVLERLAVGLAARVRGYGRFRFPRLLPGLFAVSGWRRGEQDQRALAAARIGRLLPLAQGDGAEAGDEWVAKVSEGLADSPNEDDIEAVAQLVVRRYFELHAGDRESRWVRTWYRQRPQGAAEEQGDPLVRLCLDFHQGGDLREPVERTLVAAFLEDVADACDGWWKRLNRIPRPLVLLDDAHTAAGRSFLDRLLEHRKDAAGGRDDPLVVLATHLGSGAEHYPHATRVGLADLAHASRWRRDGRDRASAGVLEVPLPPLSLEEVRTMLKGTRRPPHPLLPTVLHRLTGGNPHGSRLLCDAVVAASAERSVEPAELLDLPVAGGGRAGARLLEDLVPALPVRDHLMMLSLARDRQAGEALATEAGLVGTERSRIGEAIRYLEQEQWAGQGGGARPPAQSFVPDPFLHAVLVHEVRRASPGEQSGRQWKDLHAALRKHHEQRGGEGHEADVLRHTLAAGDAPAAVRELSRAFGDWEPVRRWLYAVQHVATAPHPPSPDWQDERKHIALGTYDGRYREADDVQRSVNRLLHALWYLADPLREPLDELCEALRRELEFLSLLHPTGHAVLYAAARSWPTAAREGRPYPLDPADGAS